MNTLADFITWAEEYFIENEIFFGHGTNNAWDEAVAIASFVLNLPPNANREVLQRKLKPDEKKRMLSYAKQRVEQRIPLAYLLKEAWFCEQKYYVDERVIVPRSPFAEIIKNKFSPWCSIDKIKNILDLCTGSGCMGIACAKTFPRVMVDLIDVSTDALEVARLNIKQHKVEDRVAAIKSDLFANLPLKKYDIIISNPPYVSPKEHSSLPAEYKREPTIALISGKDGFDCAREILNSANKFLTEDGSLFLEVGSEWKSFAKLYPEINFTWLNFKQGGEGVFMLTAKQLLTVARKQL